MKMLTARLFRLGDRLDKLLDRWTSYRLVLYLLITYVLAGLGLAAGHKLPFSTPALALSVLWLLAASRLSNMAFAWMFGVPRNMESDLITALILTLIMTPARSTRDFIVLAAAAAIAMLSKYLLTLRGRHIFNPAALGALLAGWLFHDYASWWVGTKFMAPLIALGGLLIIRKVKRGQMAMVFASVYVSYQAAYAPAEHLVSSVWQLSITSPLIFLATVMLTEPLTSPTRLDPALIYALVTGFLFSARQLHLSPEEALLIGNSLTFLISPNRSLELKYLGVKKEAEEIYSFLFHPQKHLAFSPGQYMEWTLPGVRLDGRGNRRYLTISSSPTEDEVAFSVRIPKTHSKFKEFLLDMKPGQEILAAQLAGDFMLPKDDSKKLAFIAGGVGITPFRSMVKGLMDSRQTRDVHLIYSAEHPNQLAFTGLFSSARSAGLKTTYVASRPPADWQGLSGPVNSNLISRALPDFYERTFLISGPQGFVAFVRQALLDMNVPHERIITDFFPGYS